MRSVLALPQNESHVASLAALLPELGSRGLGVAVADLDGIYHQGSPARRLPGVEVRTVQTRSPTPFYRLGALARLGVLRRIRPELAQLMDGSDVLLVFNDGAIQRLAISAADSPSPRLGRCAYPYLGEL
jgi:hypothetical protein